MIIVMVTVVMVELIPSAASPLLWLGVPVHPLSVSPPTTQTHNDHTHTTTPTSCLASVAAVSSPRASASDTFTQRLLLSPGS